MKPVSLYLHIPFCRSRCHYCGFVSCTALGQRDAYCAALRRALMAAPLQNCIVATVYFGGGTPSLLGEELNGLLACVRASVPIAPEAEITLEANPGTVTLPMLRHWRENGFNRISFGLQDQEDAILRLLGRSHTAAEGEAAVKMAQEAGFENISVDFMLATPGQTPQKAQALAEYGIRLGVPHLSSYLLKIEPGTTFAREKMGARCPDEDTAADCYLAFYETLEAAGYRHYEISNAALPGYESRHNSAYWQQRDYLGIGAGAASCMEGRRFRFPDSIEGFITAPDVWQTVIPEGAAGSWEETLMLSLRLATGLCRPAAEAHGASWAQLLRRAAPLQKAGLLLADEQHIALTDRGFLLSNSIILSLLEE